MKNKIVIISLIIFAIVLAILIGVYFIKQNESAVNPAGNTAQENQNNAPANKNGAPPKNQNENNQTSAGQAQNKMVTDEFEIIVPAVWVQTAPAMGTSLMAVNSNENINDQAAQKINFKSYFAVSRDILQGKTIDEYSQTVKSSLQQIVSNVIFTKNQNIAAINGKSAYAIEAEMSQQGVDFKVLMVIIRGERDDAWVFSFNTTKSAWDGYKEIFYNIANSFSLKK